MTDRITIRIEQDVASALERFIADGAVPLRSKQDAFRHIVRHWLAGQGYLSTAAGAGTDDEPA